MNSRAKGKRAELEFAAFLRAQDFAARRGRQFHGGAGSPDVVSTLPYHVEVKRVERLNLRDATAQAEGDCAGRPWIVAHRCNREPWLVTLKAQEFLDLVRQSLRRDTNNNFGPEAEYGRVTEVAGSRPVEPKVRKEIQTP